MQDKLQQLTQKLYEEGLSKGRSDADELVSKAREEARNIVNEARLKAESILHDAQRSAEELRKNTETEVTLASRQTIAALKESIQHLLAVRDLSPAIKKAVNDSSFLQEMILTVAKNWNGTEQTRTDLDVMLPESTQKAVVEAIQAGLIQSLGAGIEVKPNAQVKSGFKVAPKDGGYYISFTDEDFDALFREYLRPKVAKLLYGDN
ncbi:MAG: hypothetical protein LUD68_05240 [Rikenellaceae bacterium]|nr:hypothetical protein [Rikenellaceae bacterium]